MSPRREFISAHTTCDRYLEDSGIPYVIVRPNLFLQNIPELTIPSIDASGTFYTNAGGCSDQHGRTPATLPQWPRSH